MKRYASTSLRKGKTDKIDTLKIANYGLDNWYHLKEYYITNESYSELRLLGRQYGHYMKMHVEGKLELTNLLDQIMPRIKKTLRGSNDNLKKDKLSDFAEEYWHYDMITKKSEKQFINSYKVWAKKKGYHQNEKKAMEIYALAKEGI